MFQDVFAVVSAEDRVRLEAIIADRNRPQKHVIRARIILHSSDRLNVAEIARLSSVSRPAVWRWQRQFAEAGFDDFSVKEAASRASRLFPSIVFSG
jgi:hypothetical protein